MEPSEFRNELRKLKNSHPWPKGATPFILSKHCRDCPCRGIIPSIVEDCIASSNCEGCISNEKSHPNTVRVCFTHPYDDGKFVTLVFSLSKFPYKIITGWQSDSPDMHSVEPKCTYVINGHAHVPPCKMTSIERMSFDKEFNRIIKHK